MDFLSSVFDWLSDREAGISAVVGITVNAHGSSLTCQGKAVHLMRLSRDLGARWIDGLCEAGWKE